MKLLLTLSYLGTHFCGYQVQPEKRTVQGELCRAAHELFGFDCDVTGCSRTDSGVHANMFCATVTKHGENELVTSIPQGKLVAALNAHLPEDISVLTAEWRDGDFHPRYDVKYKEYIYRIYNSPQRDPFEVGRAWHCPRKFDGGQIEKMSEAAKCFVGEHDFSTFMASGSKVENTVRTVKYAEVSSRENIVTFRVAADGFLYNMVRIMTGTLISVAEEKLAPEDIARIIASQDRALAGQTAPPEGLYLNRVIY